MICDVIIHQLWMLLMFGIWAKADHEIARNESTNIKLFSPTSKLDIVKEVETTLAPDTLGFDQFDLLKRSVCINPASVGAINGRMEALQWPMYLRDAYEGERILVSCISGHSLEFYGYHTSHIISKAQFICLNDGSWVMEGELLREENGRERRLYLRDASCVSSYKKKVHCPPVTVDGTILDVVYHHPNGAQMGDRVHIIGDIVELKCKERLREVGYKLLPIEAQYSRCMANGKWQHQLLLPICERGCLIPTESSPNMEISYSAPIPFCEDKGEDCGFVQPGLLRIGAEAHFHCKEKDTQFMIGDARLRCSSNGQWSDQFPQCERKRPCTNPEFPENGYFEGDRSKMEFEPGDQLAFGCADGYVLRDAAILTCMENGQWDKDTPTCAPSEWSSKRFIATAVIGCMLGLLLVVFLVFFIQRQLLIRRLMGGRGRSRLVDQPSDARLSSAQASTAANSGRMNGPGRVGPVDWWDPDRLALIAFAEGAGGPPPYEEAVSQRRGPPPFDAISTLSGYASRAMRRLPSLSSLRSQPNRPDQSSQPGVLSRQQTNRQSTSTTTNPYSNFGADQIGSADTMAISEGSTAVTVETWSSVSQTPSVQAQAGSVTSVEQPATEAETGQLNSSEHIPLLSQINQSESEPAITDDDDKPLQV